MWLLVDKFYMKAQKSWFSTGDLIGFFTLKIPERKAQTKYAEYKTKAKQYFFMCRRECVDVFLCIFVICKR